MRKRGVLAIGTNINTAFVYMLTYGSFCTILTKVSLYLQTNAKCGNEDCWNFSQVYLIGHFLAENWHKCTRGVLKIGTSINILSIYLLTYGV